MDQSVRVTTDLQAILVEKQRDFQLLSFYKGVPFMCNARLESVSGEQVVFTAQPPICAVLQLQREVTVLSNGLLEPIQGRVERFDLASGETILTGLAYAGSKFANRLELRVEPESQLQVALELGGLTLACKVIDISMRGIGLRLPGPPPGTPIAHGGTVGVLLMLPGNTVSLRGRVRNLVRGNTGLRISIEFTAEVPEKVHVVRYIMRRRAEIFAEVGALYQAGPKT